MTGATRVELNLLMDVNCKRAQEERFFAGSVPDTAATLVRAALHERQRSGWWRWFSVSRALDGGEQQLLGHKENCHTGSFGNF